MSTTFPDFSSLIPEPGAVTVSPAVLMLPTQTVQTARADAVDRSPDCQPAGSVTDLTVIPERASAGARRAAPRAPRNEEVAQARAKRARERQQVEMAVENRLDELEHEDVLLVPRMFVMVTGSLGPAAALRLIAEHSERAYRTVGSPWIQASQASWTFHTGLSEEDWMAARSHLRELGLIQERRRFDADKGEIVTEYAFMLHVYSSMVSKVRVNLRELAWKSMKANGTVAF